MRTRALRYEGYMDILFNLATRVPAGGFFILDDYACVDAAKESGEDFVDACGKPTLALKACTDAHPEYYGALSDDGEGEGDDAKESTGPDKK